MLGGRLAGDAQPLGELQHTGALEHRAVLQQRYGQALGADAGDRQQLPCLAVALDVEPAGRHTVAREEVPQVV